MQVLITLNGITHFVIIYIRRVFRLNKRSKQGKISGLKRRNKKIRRRDRTRTKAIKGGFLFSNISIFSISFNKGIAKVSKY